MALPLALPTNPQSNQSGPQSTPYVTPYGGLAAAEFGGNWTELTRLGYMWTYSTAAAGVNIPIYTSTTQQFVLSNPSGSGVSLLLKSWVGGYVSGTPVVGNSASPAMQGSVETRSASEAQPEKEPRGASREVHGR